MGDSLRLNFREQKPVPTSILSVNTEKREEPKLTDQNVISFKLHTAVSGLIALMSFGIGAASIYYSNRAEIETLRTKVVIMEAEHASGRVAFDNSRRDLAEVQTDVRWIIKQIERNTSKIASLR